MLDAPALHPRLAADLGTQRRLQIICKLRISSDSLITFQGIQNTTSDSQVIMDFQDCWEHGVVIRTDSSLVKNDGLIVLEDQTGEPFGVSSRQSLIQLPKSEFLISWPVLGG